MSLFRCSRAPSLVLELLSLPLGLCFAVAERSSFFLMLVTRVKPPSRRRGSLPSYTLGAPRSTGFRVPQPAPAKRKMVKERLVLRVSARQASKNGAAGGSSSSSATGAEQHDT